jgi:hypothetical protein
MDTNCAEDSKIVRLLFGFVLVALVTGIGAHTILDRELARLGDSMNESDMVVENVDAIVGDLNCLDVSMRAFVSAGEGRFSDDVVLSITGLGVHMESLLQLPVKRQRLKRRIWKLNRMVKLALDSVGESKRIRHPPGSGSVMTSLDRASALEYARMEAAELKDEARQDAFSVIQTTKLALMPWRSPWSESVDK